MVKFCVMLSNKVKLRKWVLRDIYACIICFNIDYMHIQCFSIEKQEKLPFQNVF